MNSSATEQRLQATVESSPSGLLMTDGVGTIMLVNREIERLSGYLRDELIGQSVDMLVPLRSRADHPRFRKAFQGHPEARAMGGGRELYALRKDGTEVPVEIGLNPLHTDQGLYVIASVVDISARKTAERERHRLEERLREGQKLEALGTLAGGVAHDFNNILAAIVGFAELVREASRDRPQVLADLEELLRNAGRGKDLIQRILRFSRRQDEQRVPLDLTGSVNETVRLLRATLPATIEIQVQGPAQLPHVLANATSVQQVLMNLANNSAHAMPAGGCITISLETRYLRDRAVRMHPRLREGRHVVLSVRDNGVGMSEEVRARVFEPFFTTKEAGEGSGLGLALVRGIVQDHGGDLELSSVAGRGTSVTCLFPVMELPETQLADVGADVAEVAGDEGKVTRILLVDDEPALVISGERRLHAMGYEADGVTSPEEALRLLGKSSHGYDLLITDLTMPGMTGLDLARQARAQNPTLPVILVSGYPPDQSADELADTGIVATLMKPVSAEELNATIALVLTEVTGGKSQ
jgi:PAS domain S-box-containing protein